MVTRRLRLILQVVVPLLELAACLLLGIALVVRLTGGFVLEIGPMTVRAHDALRPFLQAAALLALRRWLSGALPPGVRTAVTVWRSASPAQQSAVLLALAAGTVLVMLGPALRGGLHASYYTNADWSGTPHTSRRDRTLDLRRQAYGRLFSIEWVGVIHVPREWTYRFALQADDGAWLWIDDRVVAGTAAEGGQSPETLVELSEGFHDLRLRYRQVEGEATLTAGWRAVEPDRTEQPPLLPLTSALVFPREPPTAILRLTRAGSTLVEMWWAVLALFAAAVLAVWARSVDGQQVRRRLPAMTAVRAGLSDLIELTLMAAVGWFFWLVFTSAGDATMDRQTLQARYAPPLAALAILLVARRLGRGTALDGFLVPRPVMAAAASGMACLRLRMEALPRRWIAAMAVLVLGAPVLATAVSWSAAGLTGYYYDEPTWSGNLLDTARDRQLTLRRPVFDFVNPDYRYSVRWTGVIGIEEAGDYEFAVDADGTAGLWLDGDLVAADGAPESAAGRTGTRRLDAGFRALDVRYAPAAREGQRLSVVWRRVEVPASGPFRPLSDALLFAEPPSTWVVVCSWLARAYAALAGWLLTIALVLTCMVGSRWALASRPSIAPLREPHVVFLLLTSVVYLGLALRPIQALWGFTQLARVPPDRLLGLVFVAGTVIAAVRRYEPQVRMAVDAVGRRLLARRGWTVLLATAAAGVFFLLRSENVNADGIAFRWMIPAMASSGEGVNFDEMWESYLRSRFWLLTNAWFGWSIRLSYQVLSSIAGGVFVVVLWAYARRLVPAAAPAFWLLMLSGGYLQLFFGDVEHYTLATVGIFVYFLASAGYLQGAWSLVVPSAALAVAMSLHMVAGFLAPSLVVLHLLELRRRAIVPVLIGTAVFAAILAGSVLVLGVSFDGEASWGVKALQKLVFAVADQEAESGATSHWRWFAFDEYHLDQYNLLALMLPGHLLVLVLALGGHIRLDRINVHLIVATLSMLAYHFNYLGLLGALGDWNLFAPASIPLAILVWRNFLEADGLRDRSALVIGWAALSLAHTMAWVVSNHRYAP
jgi:hypothetical protein